MSRRPRIDPSDWARRRQEALERARTTASRRDRDRIQSSAVALSRRQQHAPPPPPPPSSAESSIAGSIGGSARQYAESHLHQQKREYEQPRVPQHHPPRHGQGRGRGRGRGRRASAVGALDSLGHPHPQHHHRQHMEPPTRSSSGFEPATSLEGRYDDADADVEVYSHSQYRTHRPHNHRIHHHPVPSRAMCQPLEASHPPANVLPAPAAAVPLQAAEFGSNKLSLLKQRMLERKNHRRRAIGRPISRYAISRNEGILGGSGGSSSMFREPYQSMMSTMERHNHHVPPPAQQQQKPQHFQDYGDDLSQYDRYDEVGQHQQHSQHEQHEHQSLHGDHGDDGQSHGRGPMYEESGPYYADSDSDPFGQRRRVSAGINHDEQPVGPARPNYRHHDEQPVGHAKTSRRHHHNEKPVGPAISRRNHQQQLNWDEQPVGPSSRKKHQLDEGIPAEVDPYMYDHRMYDEDQQSSPFSGSTKNQSGRGYVWDEEGDENSDKNRNAQYQQQERQIPAQPHNNDTSKASRLMNWDEQPVGQKMSMGPQEDDDSQGSNISMHYCKSCDKWFARPTFERLHAALDADGQPRCVKIYNLKRKVYNSAKTRIKNNSALNADDQNVVIAGRKRVVTEMKAKKNGKKKVRNKSSKWKEESKQFREAMKANREWARQGK